MAKPARLSEKDLLRLRDELIRSPLSFGLSSHRWTGAVLARHLSCAYGVSIGPRHCRNLLKRLSPEGAINAPRKFRMPNESRTSNRPEPYFYSLNASQLKERAARRIGRLAHSGLPLYQYVQTLFDIVSDAVANNDIRVMGLGRAPGEQWISRNLDHARWGPLLKDLMMEAPPQVSGVISLGELRRIADSQPIITSQQFQLPGYLNSPAYNELGAFIGLHHGIMVPMKDDGAVFATYCLWREARMKPFTRADGEFLAQNAAQIAHGLATAKMLSFAYDCAAPVATMTDWPTGVILMRPDGRIEGLNQAATDIFQRLGGLEGLPLDAFGPECLRPGLDYVARVLRGVFFECGKQKDALPALAIYSHPSGVILKLRAFALDVAGGAVRFVVLIERGETDQLKRKRLMARFGLSGREYDSVRAVAAGQRPPEIARAMRVSQESVKSYLRRARDKLPFPEPETFTKFVRQHFL